MRSLEDRSKRQRPTPTPPPTNEPAEVLGVLPDDVDELRADGATLVVLARAGEEVAEDEAHLLAGDVAASAETQRGHCSDVTVTVGKRCVLSLPFRLEIVVGYSS